jgi:hypothetical protein
MPRARESMLGADITRLRQSGWDAAGPFFGLNSLKTNDGVPDKVTHNIDRLVSGFAESRRFARSSDSLSGGTTTCD